MAKTSGSLWINGNTLRWVDPNGAEWSYQGAFIKNISTGPASAGSIWIEGYNLRYVNQSYNQVYEVVGIWNGEYHSPAQGSIWIEGTSLRYIGGDHAEFNVHQDTAHTDGGGAATHVDHNDQVAHTDIPPGGHIDAPHSDTHNDWGHGDSHTDSHTDQHTDIHYDDHGDHVNTGHSDCTIYQNGEFYAHGDFYDNVSVGPYYCMWHDDVHTDSPHQDSHGDVPHHDDPGASDHTDVPHSDVPAGAHSDAPHGDTPHGDHSDAVHNDVPHVDNPTYIGP